MLRAIEETTIEGVATTLPADVVILSDEQFVQGTHSTNWVESELDFTTLTEVVTTAVSVGDGQVRKDVTAEVNGRRVTVALWVPNSTMGCRGRRAPRPSHDANTTRACSGADRPTSSCRCRAPSSR